jgi:hypothetical protein
VCVCVFKNDWRVPHMLASRSRPRCSDGACDVRCASPPPSRWWGACAKTARGGATTWVFSLPPSFSSLLLENRVAIVKNQKNLLVCLLSQIRFSFYWLQYIWPWIIYWVNLFFFYFIISHLIFISDLVLIFLIAMYLVLNHLSSFFSNSSPYTWFYIRFGTHSFNFDVYGLESFYWINLSFNFISWHFIFISNMILIILIIICSCSYSFFIEIVFQFHPL